MKKFILSIFLSIGFINNIHSDQTQMPSVADVFGTMSEDEITRQVQMGQQFLADLEKYGTPEEKAEFEKILLDTLNSMSEQDFQDIQNIAKMVEPSLQPLESTSAVQPTPTKEEITPPKISEDSVEKIKNLIATIIARIDEIVQKIESSKGCKEEFDISWSSRTTFSSMKRQIAQLKNTKLAEKLSKKDLSDDDKSLVESLEKFLKELTEKNNKLVIEDTFGLTDNKDLEQKYIKQTKDIINMLDSFIDLLTPKLEKFLSKWDPEALQLAKEAAQKTFKSTQDAQDSLKRVPSADARSTQQDRTNRSNYKDYDSYPDLYNHYGYPQDTNGQYPGSQNYSDKEESDAIKSGSSSNSKNAATAAPKDKDIGEINQKTKAQDKDSVFNDVMDHIESYFDQYDDKAASNNINFLNTVVSKGYANLTPTLEKKIQTWGTNSQGDDSLGAKPNTEGVTEWLYNSFTPYTQSVSKALDTDYHAFSNELDSAKRLCAKISESAKDLSVEETRKISEKISRLENRFSNYHTSYQATIKKIEDGFSRNFALLTDREVVGDPVQDSSDKPMRIKDTQNKFVEKLQHEIGDKVSNVVADINVLKSSIERKVKRKSKSSKSSSLIMKANV